MANFYNALTEKEREAYDAFYKKHFKCGASGNGGIQMITESCGIGQGVEVHCKGCKEQVDITDIDSW